MGLLLESKPPPRQSSLALNYLQNPNSYTFSIENKITEIFGPNFLRYNQVMGRARQNIRAATAVQPRRRLQVRGGRERLPVPCVGSVKRVTSKGLAVELKLYEAMDDGDSEGWVVDLIEAHAKSDPAGFLKLSFIPHENMQRYYSDAFIWQARRGGRGWYRSLQAFIDKPDEDWTRDQFLLAIETCDQWPYLIDDDDWKEQRPTIPIEELQRTWRKRRQELSTEYQERYEQFRDFHLDRPHVDYINVYNREGDFPYVGSIRVEDVATRDWQRQGIGTVLYETGALWMQARGLSMYTSGLQSKEAQGVWAQLHKRGLVKTTKEKGGDNTNRRIFNTTKLVREHPELKTSFESQTSNI